MLAGKTAKLAYFKPIITGNKKDKDRRLELLAQQFNLPQSYDEMYAFTPKNALKEINKRNESILLN